MVVRIDPHELFSGFIMGSAISSGVKPQPHVQIQPCCAKSLASAVTKFTQCSVGQLSRVTPKPASSTPIRYDRPVPQKSKLIDYCYDIAFYRLDECPSCHQNKQPQDAEGRILSTFCCPSINTPLPISTSSSSSLLAIALSSPLLYKCCR